MPRSKKAPADKAAALLAFMHKLQPSTREVHDAAFAYHHELAAAAAANLTRGTRVTWRGKYGRTERGAVQTVNRTTATILSDDGRRWRVSLTLLTVA